MCRDRYCPAHLDARITLMEAYIQRQSGFPASKELSRAYKLPAGLIDIWGYSQASSIHVDTLMARRPAPAGNVSSWYPTDVVRCHRRAESYHSRIKPTPLRTLLPLPLPLSTHLVPSLPAEMAFIAPMLSLPSSAAISLS
ncbi:hypothetical protein E4U48_006929 [Claviceps purpurea]|nr:hypothetical protein E4U48_006929 [Claviceps purpurea]